MYYGFNMIGYYCALYKNNPDTDLEHILRHISKGDQIQPQEMLECTTPQEYNTVLAKTSIEVVRLFMHDQQ